MIAVIFEVWPAEGRRQEYLDIAAALRPLLDQIDGFISIERFESL
jgi:heme-degrading monooxygenase HmoA